MHNEHKQLNEEEMVEWTRNFANHIKHPICLALFGDLGVGKSTFSRHFIQELTKKPEMFVPSPTFSLVNQYIASIGFPIIHTDWYRLNSIESVMDLDIDFQNSICLIEWPDIGKKLLPKKRIEIFFSYVNEEKRDIKVIET